MYMCCQFKLGFNYTLVKEENQRDIYKIYISRYIYRALSE